MAKCLASDNLGTLPDTYLFGLAYSPRKKIFATVGSDDILRLFDSRLKVLQAKSSCHKGVTSVQAGEDADFITGGRDGFVSCWDGRSKKVAQVPEPRGNGIASIACRDHYIAIGTESIKEGLGDVSVLLYDTRNFAAPLREYNESHTDTVTQLAFHPTQPNILLSGSTDGLVSIFDVNLVDEEDALQQVLNPRSAVHCAGFIAQDQAYVVSTDEQYSIHTLAKTKLEEEDVPPAIQFGDVRTTLHCTYVIDVLIQDDGPPLMAHGNLGDRTMSLVALGGPGAWGFGQSIMFPGAHGDDVVRAVRLIDRLAFSCGEDGTVRVWDLASQ